MQKLTGEQIIESLQLLFEELVSNSYALTELSCTKNITVESIDEFNDEEAQEVATKMFADFGSIENVCEESTTSGDAYFILFFKDHGVYIKVQGYYNSYESCSEYEDATFHLVVPKDKTITVYEKE